MCNDRFLIKFKNTKKYLFFEGTQPLIYVIKIFHKKYIVINAKIRLYENIMLLCTFL